MPNFRSTVARLWRSPNTRNGVTALGIAGTTLIVACSQDATTAPTAPAAARADKGTIGNVFAAANTVLSKTQLDSLKDDYDAYQRAVKSGSIVADLLRCDPKPAIAVSKVIGAKGGSFNIGPHKFTVPAGALDSNVTITGVAPAGSSAEVDFAPHGLRFHKPVEMTISYKGCVLPVGGLLGVSYVNGGQILQQMPSHDDRSLTSMTALTDHFSGYAVSWGRGSSAY